MSRFYPADILLPDFKKVDGTRYAVVACDQFTSEPAVWDETEKIVGEAPSTLRFILPELWLPERKERIPGIHDAMERALSNGTFTEYPHAMIYLRRTQSDGTVREGLIGAIDLLDYDYRPGSKPPIRATEGTVLERVPPRVDIRRGAKIELPHVMLLLDDPNKTVIEPLAEIATDKAPLYDFDLMQGGGHVTGYLLDRAEQKRVDDTLEALAPEGEDPLVFAVGDGNHSLAAAKAYFEELLETLGDEAMTHPARYALVELVNLHSAALVFRPIYRAVFGADQNDLMNALLSDVLTSSVTNVGAPAAHLTVLTKENSSAVTYPHGTHPLDVGTLQSFLDRYVAAHPGVTVDYIHGEDALASIVSERGAIGFTFPGMEKEQLFPAVSERGALPRKTFSMGAAREKRYYLEARKIAEDA
ncbi:MAG: DUF1015 domain-containing protein [Clostridia bacterium]|nr:DUF1015 domain-containing protein [Clostridia bacterium]